jgi:cysteine sulfinate desulfinase/cysteine desulfurase-like protein
MGLRPERVQGSLRFSLGRGTTAEEVARASEAVAMAIERQRRLTRRAV